MAIGMIVALIVGSTSRATSSWHGLSGLLSKPEPKPASAARDTHQIDGMNPQRQAETLLEMAVANSQGAIEQINSRSDQWRGRVQWNSQFANLTTAALNSNDLRVRQSGVEVELAAYGVSKDAAGLDYLLRTSDSQDHAEKIWTLWALGLLANRGVDPDRVVEVLTTHLNDQDVDSRRWAVEALALSGTDQAIQPLLQAMHDDDSPLVRERAACGIASSGLFTPEQRYSAVPQLLSYSDDTSLDAQTHGWAFLALRDITQQRLSNDSTAWRLWYESAARR